MNVVFFALVAIAFAVSGFRQLAWVPDSPDAVSPMQALTTSVVQSAGDSVTLAIGLIGIMALFLGLMKVAEAGGSLTILAKLLRPILVRAFPDVPADHPAMGAMVLNFAANALGLGNAATPFGIRAMQELDTLNPHKGTATNAMALFLAINTSAITLLPTGVIGLRAAAGSADPSGILPTTLFATCFSTTAAFLAVKLYQRWSPIPPDVDSPTGNTTIGETNARSPDPQAPPAGEAGDAAYPGWVSALVLGVVVTLIPLAVIFGQAISPWIIPGIIVALLTFGAARGVRVYEVLVDGARDGFQVAVRIIPYLVAILVAVGMFRASGALDVAVDWLGPITSPLGLPAEALPMALIRPLSGNGAFGVLAATIQDPNIGPDSYIGYLVSTLQGSTDTTFYTLAVYYGAIQVRRIRHTLAAGLTADVAGVIGAVIACSYLYGN